MDEPERKLDLGSVINGFVAMAQRHWGLLVGATLCLAALNLAVTQLLGETMATFGGSVISVASVYLIIRQLLRREALVAEEGTFGSYFAASFLSSFGIVIGLLLLVVPGVYLMARWTLASGLIIGQGLRANEALSTSWRLTARSAWSLTLVYFISIVAVPLIALFVTAPTEFATLEGGAAWAMLVVQEVVLDFIVVAGAYLSASIYAQLLGSSRELEEVFA